jgi:succinate dehydrogenase / fumarate reductase flavoprotein subunit
MYEQFKELADVDITTGPMEVGPTTHYAMGGVRVDAETGATRRRGLFAAGEVAGGMHGANRLGGNSLSDLLVFGRRTGAAAAAEAKATSLMPVLMPVQVREALAELQAPLERETGENPYRVQEELQAMMQSLVGIFRTDAELGAAIDRFDGLEARRAAIAASGSPAFNTSWDLAFELRNLLIVSEAIARCARLRTESRGAHSRLDHPDTDPAWGDRNAIASRSPDGMRVETADHPSLSDELRDVITKEEAHA